MAVGVANGRMSSERVSPGVCVTSGGGKIVGIPGFPGERIDRRLRKDVRRLIRKYKIYITDGYSTDPVHSANGEHPVGLALDIVPDFSRGGSWKRITRLAKWAEPQQNQPRAPFRWVGYDGDANHGRGHHLHLSWNSYGNRRFGKPVRTVYTRKCPGRSAGKRNPAPKPPEPKIEPPARTGGVISGDTRSTRKDGRKGGRRGKQPAPKPPVRSGGIAPRRIAAPASASGSRITGGEWRRATRGAAGERDGVDR